MSEHATHAEIAVLGLGSNLGDREAAISTAVDHLASHRSIDVQTRSTFIETEPVGDIDQPRFINAAVRISTVLSPGRLLEVCLDIERRLGRDRDHALRWGPRTIDIDLLLYGLHVIDEPGLCVPHPRFHERRFALEPAAEIAGEMHHPRLQASICSLFQRIRQQDMM